MITSTFSLNSGQCPSTIPYGYTFTAKSNMITDAGSTQSPVITGNYCSTMNNLGTFPTIQDQNIVCRQLNPPQDTCYVSLINNNLISNLPCDTNGTNPSCMCLSSPAPYRVMSLPSGNSAPIYSCSATQDTLPPNTTFYTSTKLDASSIGDYIPLNSSLDIKHE
jgi:hypothetical protein